MEVPANAFIWCLAQKNLQDEQKLKDHPKNLKLFWDVLGRFVVGFDRFRSTARVSSGSHTCRRVPLLM